MKKIYMCFFLYLSLIKLLIGQSFPPKREFRGVWIATINNIDWPSKQNLSTDQQRKEFINIIETHKKQGINSVFVQIRPNADAFYQSHLEPWSQWLNGAQGKPPAPFYDPLEFMIKICHKRNIEFHAWINPLRAVANVNTNDIHDLHISRKKPNWFLSYGNLKIFNPGIPAVRDYIVNLITDITKRYDIDGIHFDDYFYPYPKPDCKLNDSYTFYKYRNGFKSIGSWRRNNINILIQEVHKTIKKHKSYIKFGVSPFGVWRNRTMSKYGSNTRAGYTSYDHLYADVRFWLEKGWIDYVAPQIYQNTKHKNIPYKILVSWWSKNNFGRHVYIGQAAYRFFDERENKSWNDKTEMANQLKFNRYIDNISGSIFFSSKILLENKGNIADTLEKNFYQFPAILPAMPWKGGKIPSIPKNFNIYLTENGIQLIWQKHKDKSVKQYIIYKFIQGENIDLKDPTHMTAILHHSDTTFIDKKSKDLNKYIYRITALDRLHNESSPTGPINITTDIINKDQGKLHESPNISLEYFFNFFIDSYNKYFLLEEEK